LNTIYSYRPHYTEDGVEWPWGFVVGDRDLPRVPKQLRVLFATSHVTEPLVIDHLARRCPSPYLDHDDRNIAGKKSRRVKGGQWESESVSWEAPNEQSGGTKSGG
jgi:hypothetical protein